MRKIVQNNSFNGGPDAALESTLHGEVYVALEGAAQFKEPLKMHKKVTKGKHLMMHLMVQLKVHLLVQLRTRMRVHLKAHLKVYLEI